MTLRNLVSYDTKHNEWNSESNRDGTDNNRSWNCGAEGVADDPPVNALRRQERALLSAVRGSATSPMRSRWTAASSARCSSPPGLGRQPGTR